jgi:UDP-N-acetylmuramate--alanine ligase
MSWEGRRIHLIGVGGAGMSGYARVCVQLGAIVSGSDGADSPALARLRDAGVSVSVGHDAGNVPAGADVFYSSAIAPDNPERLGADPPARPRAELLRELSLMRRTIAIAGAHGKTTTTSMVAHILLTCGLEPGYMIGGALRSTGEHADWGAGDWLVVEADESDRSMLALDVDVAVVLNVELDHHATFASLEELQAVYDEFVAAAGIAITDWPAPKRLTLAPGATSFEWRGHAVELATPGDHNASNAIAALEACRIAGASETDAAAALASFTGAGRRFERIGLTASGAQVVDDYAHHPTEVLKTIEAARTLEPRRVVVVFQPHLFSRTRELHQRFSSALATADRSLVLDIYPAREQSADFPGVTATMIGADEHPASFADALASLDAELGEGDLCLVMGAGDIDELARALVAQQ